MRDDRAHHSPRAIAVLRLVPAPLLGAGRWARAVVGAVAVLLAVGGGPRVAHAAAWGGPVVERAAVSPLPLTITMVSDTALTLDSNSPATAGPRAMYVAYRITNASVTTASNLQATISGFASGVTLTGGQAATQYIGSLASGASRTLYWFVTYPSTFGARSVLTVTVTDGAGGTASGSAAVATVSMISAQAGGMTSASSIGAGAVIGQLIPLDATFQFKGWKAGDTFNLQPAGNFDFPAGCFQLVSTQIVSADANLNAVIVPGTLDKQFFTALVPSVGGGSAWNVQVRYTFRYLCAGATATPLPYSNQLSGTQLKYSGNYGSGGGVPNPIPPAPAPSASFVVGKTVSAAQLPSGGTATYTVTIQNVSTFAVTIDSILDVLPAGTTYTGLAAGSGVTAANSGSMPASGATGTIVWRGNPGSSYAVPAGATLTLAYTANIPATPGEYVNQAGGYVASTLLGQASATVTVGTADLAVSKSGPATVVAGDTVRYAVTLHNAGPAAAYQVVARDTLPAGVTFVSSTQGGTYAAGVVTWPTLASLAAGASVVDSVVVLAPNNTGSLLNVARATSATYDPAAANNDGSAAASRVTTAIQSSISVTPDGLASPVRQLPGTKYSQLFTVANLAPISASYSLIASQSGAPGFIVIDSLTGPGITTLTQPDSAQVTLAARSSTGYIVWYTVPAGDTATGVELLRARHATQATLQDTGYVQIRRSFPTLTIAKSVSPTGTVSPGTSLTYTVRFGNVGESDASTVIVSDNVPAAVSFKLGSAQESLPAGVSATVSYSADGGATWAYTPVSAGCGAPAGYDACVTQVRWTLNAALPPSATPSSVQFVAVVR